MASTVYQIDSNLKINGVNTSGNFTSSNIPIVLNSQRCLRMRKGTPSSFTELIHCLTSYSGTVTLSYSIYIEITNFENGYFCNDWDNRFNWKLSLSCSATSHSGDVTSHALSSFRTDQALILYAEENGNYSELGRIGSGTFTSTQTISDSFISPGWPSVYANIWLKSENDSSPLTITGNGNLGGINTTGSTGWINLNLRDTSYGTKVFQTVRKDVSTNFRSGSSGAGLSRTQQVY